jgi:hypothetical protein
MDPERLKSSLEGLDRKTKKAARRERKEVQRRTKYNERRIKRIAPYTEFAERNKRVFERAKAVAEAGPEVEHDDNSKNLVVLGIKNSASASSGNNIVARVANVRTDNYSDSQRMREHIEFTFFAVSDEVMQKIQKDPSAFKINPKGWPENAEQLGSEATYKVKSDSDAQHELLVEGSTHGRIFNPVGAIDRARDARRIPSHLDDLESTMDMVEEAARNPELNPVLAEALAGGEQGPQQIVAS